MPRWTYGRRELQRLAANKTVLSPRVYGELDQAYRESIAQLDVELETAYQNHVVFEAEELRSTREHLLRVDRTALQDLQRQGLIDTDTAQEVAEALDARLLALDMGTKAPAADVPVIDALTPIERLGRADDLFPPMPTR